MDGWLNWPNGHEFEQALGVDDGQGGLVCCSPWGHKESDRTERLSLSLPQTAWFERYTNYIAPGLPWWLRW